MLPQRVALTMMYASDHITGRGGSPGVKQQINGNADYANSDPQEPCNAYVMSFICGFIELSQTMRVQMITE